jgi:hypothetical protein
VVRRIVPLLVVAALVGCGAHESQRVRPAKIRPMDPVPPVAVRGPLPGKRVRVANLPPEVVRGSVHELLAADDGVHRLPLYIARARTGSLCIGTTGFFHCLNATDAQPALPVAGYAGMGSSVFWGAVVGLAEPDVQISVESQPLQLVHFRHFPWAAFASPIVPGGPTGFQVADARRRDVSGLIDLKVVAQPCGGETRCGPEKPWFAAGDPLEIAPPEEEATMELAKAIAIADPLVRRVLGGRRWMVRPIPWHRCSGGLIGATLEFHFAPRASLEEDWPTEGYTESSGTAYVEGMEHFAVNRVSGIKVSVDVDRARVVGVDPTVRLSPGDPKPIVHYSTLHTVQKLEPAGGRDSGNCGEGAD